MQGTIEKNAPAILIWLTALAGLALSIVSQLKICSACSMTGQYQIFGMDFGWFGIGFFVMLVCSVALRRRRDWSRLLPVVLLFASAGAEMHFIWIQKYEIGQWCPVCLSIASVVFLACCVVSWETFQNYTAEGASMKTKLLYCITIVAFFAIGLSSAILGINKKADAAELDLFLGKASSATTVYIVSDWFCPACRQIEPAIEKMVPDLAKSVKVSFVDFPIHKETLNFTPYNLQFLSFEKDKYLSLRKALSALALKTKTPSESDVQAAVAPLGVKLRQVSYADTLYGMQSNLTVYRGFNVTSTPTVVVTNSKTKKTKMLVGDNQINEQSVKAAINEVGH